MGWWEAEHVEPAWYVDALLGRVRAELSAGPLETSDLADDAVLELGSDDPGEDDWDAPLPEWAKGWRDVPEAAPNPAGRD